MREQPELTVEEIATDELVPYARNAKVHTREQVDQIAKSIEDYGFNDPVGVWDGAKGLEIVEGHGRVLAAKKLGLAAVPVIRLDHLSDEQRRQYALVHNKLNLSTGWDFDALDAELADMPDFDAEGFGFDSELTAALESMSDEPGLDDRYSQNVGTVDYEPSDVERKPDELFKRPKDHSKEIAALDAPRGIKELLRLRDAWLVEFDYAKIADYYCNQATPEVQRMFEALGLVLLDRDQMIENGFADLLDKAIGGGRSER